MSCGKKTDCCSPYTTDILQNLEGLDVKVNFFPTTTYLNDVANSVPLQVAASKGYFIGQRINTMVNPMKLTDAELQAELIQECQKIQQLTGKVPKYLMLPDGQVDARVDSIVKGLGYVPIGWNIDTLDWNVTYNGKPESCKPITDKVKNTLGELPPAWGKWILLAHDLYECTAVTIKDVFATIKDRNYTTVDMGQCFEDPTPYRDSTLNLL
jgi:peptidoglycan/xylan/chitin deacetylase (PgdA/CDA1 family)